MAPPVSRLVVDPSGAAYARTLDYSATRLWPERRQHSVRQDASSEDALRTLALPDLERVSGTLVLRLSLADRAWLHGYMDDLAGGDTLRVYIDSTDAATYADVILAGGDVDERYSPVWPGHSTAWMLEIPVLVVQEVSP